MLHPKGPAAQLTKGLDFVGLAFRRGLLFAEIQCWIDSEEAFNAKETWEYWTTPTSSFIDLLARKWPLRGRCHVVLDPILTRDHASGIEAHYDVSNEFYKLWLDQGHMFYSCAKFESPTDSLEQAQQNKASYLLSLLDPKAGEKILDLGCGWGGMLKAISSRTGDRDNLLGITLSPAQVDFCRQQGFNCEYGNFIQRDYFQNSWDTIISVGSLEHVRPNEIESLHRKLFQALPSGGRVVHQFFSLDAEPFSPYMVALQHFFPNTLLSRHADIVAAIERAGFHIVVDAVDDYRPTLRAWFDNLTANQDAAIRLVGVRTYNRYLVFLPTSWRFFEDGQARLHRLLLMKD